MVQEHAHRRRNDVVDLGGEVALLRRLLRDDVRADGPRDEIGEIVASRRHTRWSVACRLRALYDAIEQ